MKHLFISYELALKAKELGFIEPCLARYDSSTGIKDMPQSSIDIYGSENWNSSDYEFERDNNEGGFYKEFAVSAPLYQQITDWLRVQEIWITVYNQYTTVKYSGYAFKIEFKGVEVVGHKTTFKTYYEALNAAIEQAFKLI